MDFLIPTAWSGRSLDLGARDKLEKAAQLNRPPAFHANPRS
jgi:hypothetical protein